MHPMHLCRCLLQALVLTAFVPVRAFESELHKAALLGDVETVREAVRLAHSGGLDIDVKGDGEP